MILGFDVETTGLVPRGLSVTDPSYPRIVELALVLLDPDWVERQLVHLIVKPDGYEIPLAASRVHGVTTELAERIGVPIKVALATFTNLRRVASVLVGHNLEFDLGLVKSELYRARVDTKLADGPSACTKELGTPVANLPPTERMIAAGFDKPKPPTLTELHLHLFEETFEGAHGALADVRACLRCYRRLA
jgi:DNA polymerase-3 subunit epsilon